MAILRKHADKSHHIKGSVCLLCILGLLFFSACSSYDDTDAVDKLNCLSYAYHYRNLDSVSTYAQKALSLSANYPTGKAEAYNNLAFVCIAKMEYETAGLYLDSVESSTDNQVELLLADIQHMKLCQRESKNRAFYEPRGGITATGGEPLMQLGFLTSLFAEARRRGIHTVLDTSGWLYRKELDSDYDELLSCTDYVLLDIKHSNPQGHIDLTGKTQEPVLAFLSKLDEKHIPTMIRHVSVPGITDSEDELSELGRILAHHDNITGLDVLPYHTMGIRKYHEMDIPYHFEGVPAMARDEARKNRDIIIEAYHKERSRLNLKYDS